MATPTYTHRLQYDISTLKKGETVLGAFPVLAAYPVLVEHGSDENDKWLRFALFYAAKGSALQAIGDLDQKKREALRLAGVAESEPRVAAVLTWQDKPVRDLVNVVIRNQNSLEYGQWFNGTEMVWQTINMLPVPIEGSEADYGPVEDEDLRAAMRATGLRGPGSERSGELAEDKKQRAYSTKNTNFTALTAQIETLSRLQGQLFMNDGELAAQVQQDALKGQGAAERRSAGQSFIPSKKK